MDVTLNQVKAIFEEIAQKHKGINGFFWGDFLDAISSEEPASYPILICTIQPAPMGEDTTGINVMVSIWDKYNEDDREQLDDVFSDTLTYMSNVKNILLSPRFEDLMAPSLQTNNNPSKHKGSDVVAGWWNIINFAVWSKGYCAIPMDDSFNFLE